MGWDGTGDRKWRLLPGGETTHETVNKRSRHVERRESPATRVDRRHSRRTCRASLRALVIITHARARDSVACLAATVLAAAAPVCVRGAHYRLFCGVRRPAVAKFDPPPTPFVSENQHLVNRKPPRAQRATRD